MNLESINISNFLNKYIDFVDDLSNRYKYDINIRHILYAIVPAFIIKYDLKNERKILKLFDDCEIIINAIEDNYNIASFNRKIIKDIDSYKIKKYILLNKFNKVSLIELIDSLVHEFNHGINSVNNEIFIDDKYVWLRTGIIYTKYDKDALNIIDNKGKYIILEEVLNTNESEEIINIILSLTKYLEKITNDELSNMLNTLKNEVGDIYTSKAYLLQTFISKELTNNRTFTSTLNSLRFSGEINDIENWFNNITGIKNSYSIICDKLSALVELEKKYMKSKYFRNIILSKIKYNFNDISIIIETFNNNCIYK